MRRVLLAALCLAPLVCRAADDPVALLPAGSRHVFISVDPAWRKTVNYLKLRPDAYEQVDHPTDREKKQLYREIRYFADKADNPKEVIKIVIFYPDGQMRREIDNIVQDGKLTGQFVRRFRPSGKLEDYMHWSRGKWVAGLAVDPRTKQVSHFADGNGWLTSYEDRPGNYKEAWYRRGDQILEVSYRDSRRSGVSLHAGDDSLEVSDEEEKLVLSSECEAWSIPKGYPPSVQIMEVAIDASTGKFFRQNVPEKTDIRRMPQSLGGPSERREAYEKTCREIEEEWKIAYPKRKAAFLERFRKLSQESDKVLADLGIEIPGS